MAIYHLTTKPVSRRKGRSATAAAAYRSASRIRDERTGQVFDYRRKKGVVFDGVITPKALESETTSRETLWNMAELAERRKDARVAREWEIALPHELSDSQREELATQYAQHLSDRYGVAVDVCIHRPHRDGDQKNHHAHLLATTRCLKKDGIGEKAAIEFNNTKRKKFGLKKTEDEIAEERKIFSDMTNRALECAGHESRVDHRSLVEQRKEALERGDLEKAECLNRAPGVHLGPKATAMERRKRGSCERGSELEACRKLNDRRRDLVRQIQELERAQAQENEQAEREVQAQRAEPKAVPVEPPEEDKAVELKLRPEVPAVETESQSEPPESVEAEEALPTPAKAKKRIDLFVSFKEKDEARAHGARWDQRKRIWFAPKGLNLEPLRRWLPPQIASELGFEESEGKAALSPEAKKSEAEQQEQDSDGQFDPAELWRRSRRGDVAALALLRSLQSTSQVARFSLSVRQPWAGEHVLFRDCSHQVLRSGDVLYELYDGGKVRDQKTVVGVEHISTEAIALGLKLACARFGQQKLVVNGTAEFRRQVAEVAAELGMKVRFAEPGMERMYRQRLKGVRSSAQVSEPPRQEEKKTEEKSFRGLELEVPFKEKDQAKVHGARWDQRKKTWYAPPDADLVRLYRWVPKETDLTRDQLRKLTFRQLKKAQRRIDLYSPATLINHDPGVKEARKALEQLEKPLNRLKRDEEHGRSVRRWSEGVVEKWEKSHGVVSRAFNRKELRELKAEAESARKSWEKVVAELEPLQAEYDSAHQRWEKAREVVRPSAEFEAKRRRKQHKLIGEVLKELRKEKEQLRPESIEKIVGRDVEVKAAGREVRDLEVEKEVLRGLRSEEDTRLYRVEREIELYREAHPYRSRRFDQGKGQRVARELWELTGEQEQRQKRLEGLEATAQEKDRAIDEARSRVIGLRKKKILAAAKEHKKQKARHAAFLSRYEPEWEKQELEQSKERKRSKQKGRGGFSR